MEEMRYKEYVPHYVLANHIRCYWVLEGIQGNSVERIFPDGQMELIFHYGDKFYYTSGDEPKPQPRSFLFGQLSNYIDIIPSGQIGIIGVRFQPAAVSLFTDMPLHHLTNELAETEWIWSSKGKELSERILSASGTCERIRYLDQFFIGELNTTKSHQYLFHNFLAKIHALKGTMSIEQMAKELCLTQRSLERKFLDNVGLNPKSFCRIIRLQHTLHLLRNDKNLNLTKIAQQAGYYDQSHFIKEFKGFTGLTPSAYYRSQYILNDQFLGID